MTLLVIGASGFLGASILEQARASQEHVVAGTRRPGHGSGSRFVDLLDLHSLRAAMSGISTVVNAAGLAHVFDRRKMDSAPFHALNERGVRNVACVAVELGVSHLVNLSSIAVYGTRRRLPWVESDVCEPSEPYALSKWHGELAARTAVEGSETRLTLLRMATTYGEKDRGNVARLIRAINSGRFFWVGDGANRKSLIHRDDAGRACVLAALHPPIHGGGVYNVSAPPVTMREVVDILGGVLGRRVPGWSVPAPVALGVAGVLRGVAGPRSRLGGIADSLHKWLGDDACNVSAFSRDYNFVTRITLRDGLARQVAASRYLAVD